MSASSLEMGWNQIVKLYFVPVRETLRFDSVTDCLMDAGRGLGCPRRALEPQCPLPSSAGSAGTGSRRFSSAHPCAAEPLPRQPGRAGCAPRPGSGMLQSDGTGEARLSRVPVSKTPLKHGEMSNGRESAAARERELLRAGGAGPGRDGSAAVRSRTGSTGTLRPSHRRGSWRRCSCSNAGLLRSCRRGNGVCIPSCNRCDPRNSHGEHTARLSATGAGTGTKASHGAASASGRNLDPNWV